MPRPTKGSGGPSSHRQNHKVPAGGQLSYASRSEILLKLEKLEALFRSTDTQNKTIIVLLNKVEAQLERLGNSIDDKIGQRIETLRKEIRKALELFVVREDNTGDAQKIIRDHLFNRPERKKD